MRRADVQEAGEKMQAPRRRPPQSGPSVELSVRRLREPDGRALLLYRVTITPHSEAGAAPTPDVTGTHDVRGRVAPATDRPAGAGTGSRADG